MPVGIAQHPSPLRHFKFLFLDGCMLSCSLDALSATVRIEFSATGNNLLFLVGYHLPPLAVAIVDSSISRVVVPLPSLLS